MGKKPRGRSPYNLRRSGRGNTPNSNDMDSDKESETSSVASTRKDVSKMDTDEADEPTGRREEDEAQEEEEEEEDEEVQSAVQKDKGESDKEKKKEKSRSTGTRETVLISNKQTEVKRRNTQPTEYTGRGNKNERLINQSHNQSKSTQQTNFDRSEKKPHYEEECNYKTAKRCSWVQWVFIVGTVIVAGLLIWENSKTNAGIDKTGTCHAIPVDHRLGNLTNELESVRAEYPTLDDDFWDMVGGSSWTHVQGSTLPNSPVVLLLAGQPGEGAKLNKVAADIAQMYTKVFSSCHEFINIHGEKQQTKEMSKAKLDMDSDLKFGFRDKNQKVALITHFDKVPPCSVMLYHSYCDNENAPHVDAVIIFTVELRERMPFDADAAKIEKAVQDHLAKSWALCPEELSEDKIMAMHSRVANSIAFVR